MAKRKAAAKPTTTKVAARTKATRTAATTKPAETKAAKARPEETKAKPAKTKAKPARSAGRKGPPAGRGAGRGASDGHVDLHETNDSSAMVLAAPEALGRGLDSGSAGWLEAVEQGRLWCVDLGMDASIDLRLRVGGSLTPEEEAEWVGRLEHRLDLPSGRLAVAGGIEVVIDAGVPDDVRLLEVPAGVHRATLYAYVTSPLGEGLVGRLRASSPVGAWWRATRPGEDLPEWVADRCRSDPAAADPGHEAEWVNVDGPRSPAPTVDWLLHLEPLAGEGPPCPARDEQGWFGPDAFEARARETCPSSLPLDPDALGAGPREPDDDEPREPSLPEPVYPRVAGLALAPLEPVDVPLVDLARVLRLTWFPSDGADPELRLEPAPGRTLPAWRPVEGVYAFPDGAALRLAFRRPGGGNPFAWELGSRGWPAGAGRALAALATALEGATLEGCAAAGGAGVARLRGPIARGVWRVAAAHPPVEAARLREALALSAEVDAGRTLRLAPGERALLEAWEAEDGVVLAADGNALSLDDRQARLAEASPDHLGILARVLFRARFADVWPCEGEDGEAEAPPPGGGGRPDAAEQLLAGRQGTYRALRGRPPELFEALEPLLDAAYAPHGHRPLGTFASSANDEAVLRAYGKPGATALAFVVLSGVGDGFHQALTRFPDGAWLSTWSMGEGTGLDAPERKLYRQAVAAPSRKGLAKGVADLLAKHEARAAALAAVHGPPLPATPTLAGAAEALDGYRDRVAT